VTLLSVSDVAKLMKIPQSTIRRWIHEQRMVRYGNKIDYGRALEVLAEIGAGRNRSTRGQAS